MSAFLPASFCGESVASLGQGGLLIVPAGEPERRKHGEIWLARISCVVLTLCFATAIAAPAQTFDTLFRFNYSNGALPGTNQLVQGFDGNFYGTTQSGGENARDCSLGCGTVFRLTPTGSLTVLYSFCAEANCADGASPSSITLAANGQIYGTTTSGGSAGSGTIFKITAAGKLTTIYSSCSLPGCADGIWPQGLVQAANGNFYGTTQEAGGEAAILARCSRSLRRAN
jgi:uncharacterized repeat protein (TIGR03803 family)